MKDTDYYRILGFASLWKVTKVCLAMERQRVTVRVDLEAGTKWVDSVTWAAAYLHKWTERNWRQKPRW